MSSSIFSEINWLAVLVAAIAYFALGALWYSVLFGKQWVMHQKIDMNDPEVKKGTGAIMIGSFIIMLISCIGLAVLVQRLDLIGGLMSGIKLGLVTGICFSAAAISVTYLYIKKSSTLHFIDGLYHVIGQVIAAIILCLWR
jgi:hypothetical protein